MSYVKGLLFGLTLQLAVGPVFLGVLHRAIERGFREAFAMAWGVTLVDALYIAASFFGMAKLLQTAAVRQFVLVAGAGVLAYFGLSYFVDFRRGKKKTAGREPVREANSFLYGVKLTATNPLTVIFWSGAFGSLLASGTVTGTAALFTYALGCVSATILFLSFLSLGGEYTAKLMNEKTRRWLNYAVGLFLLFWSGKMLLG